MSDVNGEDDGVLGALSGRGPEANGVHGAFSFAPGNLGFGHTGKTSSGKDAHMAYLMLRHLKLRHMRRSVGFIYILYLLRIQSVLHFSKISITF